MLTFAEEIILLALDDESGAIQVLDEQALDTTLAGAVLMELALNSRIDTDLDKLILVDDKPLGEELLDTALGQIAKAGGSHGTEYWVTELSRLGPQIKQQAIDRLVGRGILKVVDEKILWVSVRRYPMIDDRQEREVKHRLMDVILTDKIPEPRDVVLICLADSAAIFQQILSDREYAKAAPRIEQVRKLDLIGQALARTIERLRTQLAMAMASIPF